MNSLKQVLKDYREAGSVQTLVGVECMLDQRTFLARSGELLTVLKATGRDPECLDPSELDATVRRWEGALRTLDDAYRLQQVQFKSPHPGLSRRTHADPVVEQALSSRHDDLTARSNTFFVFETYVVVSYLGWRRPPSRGARRTRLFRRFRTRLAQVVSADATQAELEHLLARAQLQLRETVDALVIQAGDAFSLSVANEQEAFRFLRRLLNYNPNKSESGQLARSDQLPAQLADSALDCYPDHLRLDDRYIRVLTLKYPPPKTFAHLLRDLNRISCSMIVSTEWQRLDGGAARRLIQSRRRHFYSARTSFVSQFGSSAKSSAADVLVDDGADAVVNELGQCLTELEVGGKGLGAFSLTIVLHGGDLATVARAASECFKVFAAHDARVIDERYNLLNAWLSVLPGNSSHNLRRSWLLDSNYADLSLLFELSAGSAVSAHLKDEHLAVFETDGGIPFYFNLHYEDIGHSLILGPTGSGKSFLLNFLITSLKKYNPAIFIFDLGGGYAPLTRLFGGGYLSLARGTRGSINPFALPNTPDNLHFLVTFCQVLAESSGYRLSDTDERDLRAQIENVYTLEAPERRLRTLSQLTNRNLRAHFAKWVEGGAYGEWFDNVTDTVSMESFQTLDFEGLGDYPQVLEALVFYVLHRANEHLADSDTASRLKILVLDEAWRFLRHPAIRAYVVEALKTWRKKNAAVVLATQSVDDLTQSELLSVVSESCPTKLFLANPHMNREQYQQLFHLNYTEVQRITELTPKRQLLLKRPDIAKVLTLNVDQKSYWLYTNSPTENALRQNIFDHHGLEQGLEILARRNP